jgi:hypothetical protein
MSNTSNKRYDRRKSSTSRMMDAVDDKNVENLIWAFIDLSVKELKNEKVLKTLSANHIISLMDQLIKMEKDRPQSERTEDLDEIRDFLTLASK